MNEITDCLTDVLNEMECFGISNFLWTSSCPDEAGWHSAIRTVPGSNRMLTESLRGSLSFLKASLWIVDSNRPLLLSSFFRKVCSECFKLYSVF
jgi:hypothetical protein